MSEAFLAPQTRRSTPIHQGCSLHGTLPCHQACPDCCKTDRRPSGSFHPTCFVWCSKSPKFGSPDHMWLCTHFSAQRATCKCHQDKPNLVQFLVSLLHYSSLQSHMVSSRAAQFGKATDSS